MSNVKYKQAVTTMYQNNTDLFADFAKAHASFTQNRKSGRKKFDEIGKQVMEIAQDAERQLCGGMERGKNAVYSAKLAEKFWEEIRKTYPLIMLVGVESSLG